LGRFINRDPIEYQSNDINLLRIIFNKILNKIDSLGLQDMGALGCFGMDPYNCQENASYAACQNLRNPPPLHSTKSCDGYDISIGSKCSDKCGHLIDDPYPHKAKNICKEFIKMYDGSTSVNCVAKCLVDNEKNMLDLFSCDERNNKRLDMHCFCYAKCGFFPHKMLPSGGWDVGIFMLLPSFCRIAIIETGRCASEGMGPKW
jgi:hypothetical protein